MIEQCKNVEPFFVNVVCGTLEDGEIQDATTTAHLKSVLMDGQPQSLVHPGPKLAIYQSSARSSAVLACSLGLVVCSPSVAISGNLHSLLVYRLPQICSPC